MLNEIREFEQYQEVYTDVKDIGKFRLRYYPYFKQNHKNGLRRAMIIVARKALEERGYFQTQDIPEQKKIIERVKNDLEIWCGFKEPDGQTTIQPWLIHYYRCVTQINVKYETWEQFSRYYGGAFSKGIFEASLENKKNTINEITYEGVIADAIFQGPLKRYYLVCKPNGMEGFIYKKSETNDSGKKIEICRPLESGKKNKGKDDEKLDCIRKFVAAYLIKQRYTENSYNVVNNVDLANWTQNNDIFKVVFFNKFTYKNIPIYEREAFWVYNPDEKSFDEEKQGKDCKKTDKCRPNPQYITDYNFRIVSEEEFDRTAVEENGDTFFSDMGSYINDGEGHCYLCEGIEYKDMPEKYSIKC